jgi:dihydropteroate synthase
MGIVNCTEDSFYSGSHSSNTREAVDRALTQAESGAGIIDFGGESSRPGAAYVSEEEEIRRVIPVIEAFRKRMNTPVSVDTRKARVALLALDAGADIINDISAMEDEPKIGALCAERKAPIILMHKKGVPSNMQDEPYYEDVVREVSDYLLAAAERAKDCGVPAEHIILDPGIGFGKRTEDNLDLIANLKVLCSLGYPLLMALSRKTFIGQLTGRDATARLAGTLAANAVSVLAGAAMVRVHDVPETVDLVKVIHGIRSRISEVL